MYIRHIVAERGRSVSSTVVRFQIPSAVLLGFRLLLCRRRGGGGWTTLEFGPEYPRYSFFGPRKKPGPSKKKTLTPLQSSCLPPCALSSLPSPLPLGITATALPPREPRPGDRDASRQAGCRRDSGAPAAPPAGRPPPAAASHGWPDPARRARSRGGARATASSLHPATPFGRHPSASRSPQAAVLLPPGAGVPASRSRPTADAASGQPGLRLSGSALRFSGLR